MPRKDRDGLYRRGDSPYWWASYTDVSGRRIRRSTGHRDKREAAKVLAKWKLEAETAWKREQQQDWTFDELMLAYLDATQDSKRSHGRDLTSCRHLYPAFSGRKLRDILAHDVRAYITQRRKEGAAASTINKEVGLLSSAINYARRELGWDIHNPAQGCRQREPEGRLRWLTKAEAAALVEAARQAEKAPHLADFIILALNTGMRSGEILGLEWRRVDLSNGLIWLEAEHTKTARRRTIPINAGAKTALLSRLNWRARHCQDSPWVFCDQTGRRIASVKKSFETACKRAGIEDFRIHDLRHTCAAWLVTAGVPLAEVRDLLGHRSIQMTERYAHLAPENVRSAVQRLDGDFGEDRHVVRHVNDLGRTRK